MELVDEQEDPALALLDLTKDRLQALLELAPVLGAGHQRAHVEGEQLPILQVFGHVPPGDPLGQALGDGGLAHAGLADEAGVVLGLAGEDADDAADLVVAADDRVQLLLPGQGSQILAVLFQHVVGVLRVVGVHLTGAADLLQGGEVPLHGHVVPTEQGAHVLVRLGDEAHHQMLHGDVAVAHLLHARFGLVQGFVQRLGSVELAAAAATIAGLAVQQVRELALEAGHVHLHGGEKLGVQVLSVVDQRVQQVGLLHLGMVSLLGHPLGGLDGFDAFLGELVGIHRMTPFRLKVVFLPLFLFSEKKKRRKKKSTRIDNGSGKKESLFLKVLFGPFSFKKKDRALNKHLYYINLQTSSENAAGSSRGNPAMSRACW